MKTKTKLVYYILASVVLLAVVIFVGLFRSGKIQISADVKCGKPQCLFQGTRSEGWYDNCGRVTWANCSNCTDADYATQNLGNGVVNFQSPEELVDTYGFTTNGLWYTRCNNNLGNNIIYNIKYEPGYSSAYDAMKGIFNVEYDRTCNEDSQTVKFTWPISQFIWPSNTSDSASYKLVRYISGESFYNDIDPDTTINNFSYEITYPKEERTYAIANIFGESNSVTIEACSTLPEPSPDVSPETEQTCAQKCQELGFDQQGECSGLLIGGFNTCPNSQVSLYGFNNCPAEGDQESDINCCCAGDSENKPATPRDLSSTVSDDNSITINISTVENADYYRLATHFGSALPPEAILSATVQDDGSDSVSYTFSGLECETDYTFAAVAFNEYEGYTLYSDISNPITVSTGACGSGDPSIVNRQPGGVNISQTSLNSVTLSWAAVEGAVGYNIYDCDGNYIISTTDTSFTFTNLLAAVEYCFYVEAHDGAGNRSLASEQVRITPIGYKGGVTPAQPSSLTSTGSNIWIYLAVAVVLILGIGYFIFKKEMTSKQ